MACKWYYDNPVDIGNLDEGFCRLVPGSKCSGILAEGMSQRDCDQYAKAV